MFYSMESIGRKHRLIVKKSKAEHTGEIKFVASNASCTARFNVLEPPVEFITPLKDVKAEEKSDVTMECEVSVILILFYNSKSYVRF